MTTCSCENVARSVYRANLSRIAVCSTHCILVGCHFRGVGLFCRFYSIFDGKFY